MIDLDYARLDAAQPTLDPFPHVVVPNFVPPDSLKDPLGLPLLVAEMQSRGYRPERIHKMLGGNFVRCLRALRPG